MTYLQLTLFLSPPIIAVAYALLEYYGVLDKLTGRKYAVEGLKRLQSTAGYPVSMIYDDDKDARVFLAVTKRVLRRTRIVVKDDSGKAVKPTGVSVAGKAVALDGVPNDWPQEQRFVYTSQHPILLLYGAKRGASGGKAHRACGLGEFDKWLSEEKETRKHWVGAIAIGLISMGLIVLRLGVAG